MGMKTGKTWPRPLGFSATVNGQSLLQRQRRKSELCPLLRPPGPLYAAKSPRDPYWMGGGSCIASQLILGQNYLTEMQYQKLPDRKEGTGIQPAVRVETFPPHTHTPCQP